MRNGHAVEYYRRVKPKCLHIAAGRSNPDVWIEAFCSALREIADLEIVENGAGLGDERVGAMARGCDVLLTAWDSVPIPPALAGGAGRLRYVCNVTGTLRHVVPLEIIDAGIPVTNWGDAPAREIAEGAMALLLAALKDLRQHVERVGQGEWARDGLAGGRLKGAPLGIYGCGAIGRAFVEMLRPFGPVVRVFDPYAGDLPDGCVRVDSLEELFATSRVVVVHAGLTDETRHSVTAKHLALMRDNGVVVNTARGAIIDHDALFAELATGRLRAGLDVTDPEPLPADHPARSYPNCIITPHCIWADWSLLPGEESAMGRMHHICLQNIERFVNGEPLAFVMDRERYLRST